MTDFREQFSAFLNQQTEAGIGTATAALSVARGTKPEQAAEALALAQQTGIPAPVVERNPEEARAEAFRRQFRSFAEKAPSLREFLADEQNAKLAQNDIPHLAAFNAAWNSLKRGGLRVQQGGQQFMVDQSRQRQEDLGRGLGDTILAATPIMPGRTEPSWTSVGPVEASMGLGRYAAARLNRWLGQDESVVTASGLADIGSTGREIAQTPMSEPATRAQKAIMEAGKQGLGAALSAAAADPLGALALGLEVGGEFLPQIGAATVATAATRSPTVGAAMMGGASGLTERYTSPAEFLQSRGFDLTKPDDIARLMASPQVMDEAAHHGFTRGAIIGSIDFATAGIAGEALMRSPIGNMIAQTVVQMVGGGGGEALAQQVTTGAVNWGEVALEAIGEMATAPAEVVGVGGQYLRQKDAAASTAQAVPEALASLRETVAAAQVTSLHPDTMRRFIDTVAGEDGKLFIPADELISLRQDGIDIDAILDEWQVTDQVEEAVATGGDLVVDAARFLTGNATGEHFQILSRHVRLDPGSWTAAEADAYAGDREAEIAALVDRLVAQGAEPGQGIYDDVFRQVVGAGRSTREAEAVAALWRERYLTRAERTGMSPEELYAADNVTVTGPDTPEPAPRRDMVDVALARLQSGRTDAEDGPEVAALADQIGAALEAQGIPADEATPEQARAALEGRVTLNQPDGGTTGPQGVYSRSRDLYGNVSNLITLTAKADRSTFLHESGHFWLFQLAQDATDPRIAEDKRAKLRADLGAIMKWFGVDVDLATADADTIMSAITTNHHELWARGVETYFMEGSAPSESLAPIFQKFTAWLVKIYRSLRNIPWYGKDITPSVREVMDRLLATDDAIDRAKQGSAFKVPDGLEEVLTEAERAKLQEAAEQANLAATRDLQAEVMAELRREKKEWWKEERAKVEEEVSAEVRKRPLYAALNLLKRGEAPDGSMAVDENGAEIKPKLDRKALTDEFGKEIVRMLPPGVSAPKGGIAPQTFAEMVGFANTKAMVEAMMNAEPMAEVIRRETDATMKERHGDILNDGSIEEEAAAAVTSDKQLELVALQASYLRRMAGDTLARAAARQVQETGAQDAATDQAMREAAAAGAEAAFDGDAASAATAQIAAGLTDAIAGASVGQRRAQAAAKRTVRNLLRGMDNAALKAAAQKLIERKTVAEAMTPDRYRQQAARLGTKAELAIAARDYDAAADFTEQRLLNLHLAKEAQAAKESIAKAQKKFSRLNKSDKKLVAGMDIDFAHAARAILAPFGLARPDKNFTTDEWLKMMAATDEAGAADLKAIIEAATETPQAWRALSFGRFQELSDTVTMLLKMGRDARSLELDGQRVEIADIVAELDTQVAARAKDVLPGTDRAMTEGERRWFSIRGMVANLTRVESWARMMDGGKAGGPFQKYILRPVLEAAYAYRAAKADRLKQLLAILEPAKADLVKPRTIEAPELGYTFTSRGELLHAILHSGNDSNFKKLLLGRGWGRELPDGDFDRSRWNAFIARAANQGVITKQDFDLAQAIWDLLEDTKGPAQKAHKAMFGFYFPEVKADKINTPFGVYRGGYVPAITDNAMNPDGGTHLDADALASQQSAAMFPAADRGFTKARANYNRPLQLDLSLLPSHLDKVLKFTHLGPEVRKVARIVKNGAFGETMQRVDPHAINDMLIPWLERSARQTLETPSIGTGGRAFSRIASVLRRRAGLQAMAGNIINAAQQIVGFPVAAVRVKPAHLMRALVAQVRNGKALTEDMKAKSGLMRDRMNHSAMEMMGAVDEILKDDGSLGKVRRLAEKHSYFAQTFVQNLMDRVIWTGAYEQGIANGMTEREAALEADSVIRTTQAGMTPEDVSRFETGHPFMRLFTHFYSYFNAQANLLGSEVDITVREMGLSGGKKRLAYIYIMGAFIPSVVAEVIVQAAKGELGDDDDDGLIDDLASIFLLSQLRYFAAMIPGVGQGSSFFINALNDKPYDDRMSTAPAASQIEGALRAPVSVYGAIADDKPASKAVKDVLSFVGLATGLPVGQLGKPAGYVANVAEGRANPEGPFDIGIGLLSGRDPTQK